MQCTSTTDRLLLGQLDVYKTGGDNRYDKEHDYVYGGLCDMK